MQTSGKFFSIVLNSQWPPLNGGEGVRILHGWGAVPPCWASMRRKSTYRLSSLSCSPPTPSHYPVPTFLNLCLDMLAAVRHKHGRRSHEGISSTFLPRSLSRPACSFRSLLLAAWSSPAFKWWRLFCPADWPRPTSLPMSPPRTPRRCSPTSCTSSCMGAWVRVSAWVCGVGAWRGCMGVDVGLASKDILVS